MALESVGQIDAGMEYKLNQLPKSQVFTALLKDISDVLLFIEIGRRFQI